MLRSTVHYTGRVQGVGFRATARRLASGRDVSGYVQNLPDGRVKLVVEGERADMDELLATLGRRMSRHIEAVARDDTDATGEFRGEGLTIRH